MPSTKKRIARLGAAFLAISAVATSAFLIASPANAHAAGVTQQTSLQTISLTGTGLISGGATSLVAMAYMMRHPRMMTATSIPAPSTPMRRPLLVIPRRIIQSRAAILAPLASRDSITSTRAPRTAATPSA